MSPESSQCKIGYVLVVLDRVEDNLFLSESGLPSCGKIAESFANRLKQQFPNDEKLYKALDKLVKEDKELDKQAERFLGLPANAKNN